MSYQALYRKYRPKRFCEVLGQEHITTILKNQVAAGRTTHAYLFLGSRGTGKTSTAKILAKAINCLSPENGEPCGMCEACLHADEVNADILEIDAASNTGIDNIRMVIDRARYAPLTLKNKVYIIDEVHELSHQAFNALLKTLEEPPAHVVFILATTEPQSVPATIVSRCQRFDFHRHSIVNITACLTRILLDTGATIDEEGLVAIARSADGGMRDALSLADQCIAFCGNHVTAKDVYNILGSMDKDFLFDMADAIIASDSGQALRLVERVVGDGRDLAVFTADLIGHLRALLMAKLCGHCADLLDCTEDAMRRYLSQAERCSEQRLARAIDTLLLASGSMKRLALPRVQLENALVRIAFPEGEPATERMLLERVEQLEGMIANRALIPEPAQALPERAREDLGAPEAGGDFTSADLSAASAASADSFRYSRKDPSAAPDAAAAQPILPADAAAKAPPADPKAIWNGVRGALAAKSPTLSVLALKATELALSGNTLIVGFDKRQFFDAFLKEENRRLIEAALEASSPGLELKLVHASGADELERAAEKAFGSKLQVFD